MSSHSSYYKTFLATVDCPGTIQYTTGVFFNLLENRGVARSEFFFFLSIVCATETPQTIINFNIIIILYIILLPTCIYYIVYYCYAAVIIYTVYRWPTRTTEVIHPSSSCHPSFSFGNVNWFVSWFFFFFFEILSITQIIIIISNYWIVRTTTHVHGGNASVPWRYNRLHSKWEPWFFYCKLLSGHFLLNTLMCLINNSYEQFFSYLNIYIKDNSS